MEPVTDRGPRRRGRTTVLARGLLASLIALGTTAAVLLGAGLPGSAPAAAAAPGADSAVAEEPVTLTFYWGDGCPRCAEEEGLLDRLEAENPDLVVARYEIWFDEANRERFREESRRLGIDATSVPTTVLGERVWVGFTEQIGQDIERSVEAALAGEPVPGGLYGRSGEGTCDSGTSCEAEGTTVVDVPLVGAVDVASTSLVVSTLAIGFVDGINPCSLWVISILLALVIRTGSRRRVLAIGTTFLLVTAGMYALYMVGIYSALTVIGYIGAVQVVIGLAAAVFGAINVKDYFAFKRGVSLSIPEGSKPGIYRRMRQVTAQSAIVPALAATVALAVGVSVLETPCTAGFPVLWTGLLAANEVTLAESAGLFGLYMVPFLLDEFAVFLAAVATMKASRLQEKHGRVLKLVAGVVMLALAAVMLLAPEVMENVLGALLVFVGAGLVAGVIHGATLLLRRVSPAADAVTSDEEPDGGGRERADGRTGGGASGDSEPRPGAVAGVGANGGSPPADPSG